MVSKTPPPEVSQFREQCQQQHPVSCLCKVQLLIIHQCIALIRKLQIYIMVPTLILWYCIHNVDYSSFQVLQSNPKSRWRKAGCSLALSDALDSWDWQSTVSSKAIVTRLKHTTDHISDGIPWHAKAQLGTLHGNSIPSAKDGTMNCINVLLEFFSWIRRNSWETAYLTPLSLATLLSLLCLDCRWLQQVVQDRWFAAPLPH